MNLYNFVGNNPLSKWDILGHKWKKKKTINDGARRLWKRTSKNDTFEKLAGILDLDPKETTKWARKEDAGGCIVSVPNVWIDIDVLRGGGAYDRLVNIGGNLGRFFTFTGRKKRIKINHLKNVVSKMKKYSKDIIGINIYGHGGRDGELSMPAAYKKDKNGDYYLADASRILPIQAVLGEVDANGFKLSKAYLMQCYSGFKGVHRGVNYDWAGAWDSRVTGGADKYYAGLNVCLIDAGK